MICKHLLSYVAVIFEGRKSMLWKQHNDQVYIISKIVMMSTPKCGHCKCVNYMGEEIVSPFVYNESCFYPRSGQGCAGVRPKRFVGFIKVL